MNYLYNGAELPDLPNVDRETYQYVYMEIVVSGAGNDSGSVIQANAYFSKSPFYVKTAKAGDYPSDIFDGRRVVTSDAVDYVHIRYKLATKAWEEPRLEYNRFAHSADTSYSVRWTNPINIPDLDNGTTWLEASDPIPVGSAPEVEPKAFMAGWLAGRAVRGLRGQ